MKYLILVTLLVSLFLYGCNNDKTKAVITIEKKVENTTNVTTDEEQIESLVKQLYKWQESKTSIIGFVPIPDKNDSIYVGMDLKELKKGIKVLRESNFFSNEFLDNYNRIVLTIDKKLKNKDFEWIVGELPPFGNDANAWCNCQDYPYDNPWDNMKFEFISINNENAVLTWTWGNSEWSKDFNYKVKVIKIGGKWKISYLQGFDFYEFTRKNY